MATLEKQQWMYYKILTDQEKERRLNPDHPDCPFFDYVGNRNAVDEILDIAAVALDRKKAPPEDRTWDTDEWCSDHLCNKRIALLGPASVGKTTFCRKFAEVLDLPYLETVADQIHKPADLFDQLVAMYESDEWDLQLVVVGERHGKPLYELPPSILCIDEIHLMPKRIQDGFLKAFESNDGLWIMEEIVVDCRNVCIVVATTSHGVLREAFKTRFDKITLHRHTSKELAKIIQNKAPTWQLAWCLEVAKLKPVPREALDFITKVDAAASRGKLKIPDAIKLVAARQGIHEGGVTATAVKVLKQLATVPNGLSSKSLCTALGIEEKEFDNDVKPCLLANEYHPAYIQIDLRHSITAAGRKFIVGK